MKEIEDTNIGKILKKIRTKKGVSTTAFMTAMALSASQLSKIERGEQSVNADFFIKALSYLNVTFEEFGFLFKDSYFKARVETKRDLKNLIIDLQYNHYLKAMMVRVDKHYQDFKEPYFLHIYSMLDSRLILSETGVDFEKARTALKPVKDYLLSVETWFEYEIGLFSNCYYLFPIEETIKIANETLSKMKNSSLARLEELTRDLFINLALYALEEKDYCTDAIDFASQALNCQVKDPFYTSLMVRVLKQIAYYKLESPLYSESQLSNLIKGLNLLDFGDLSNDFMILLKKHEIPISNC